MERIWAFQEWAEKIGKATTFTEFANVCSGIFEDDRLTDTDRDVLEFLANMREWGLNWSQRKNSG